MNIQILAFITLCMFTKYSEAAYNLSADGSEVTDTASGLTWSRCAAGQSWGGTACIGLVRTYTHEQALQHATVQSANSGKQWRLPNIKELASLIKESSQGIISVNYEFKTANTYFWSSSPYAVDANSCWSVSFNTNSTVIVARYGEVYVRLVR